MQIEKVLNNNVAVATDEKNREVIVMGCGLGFGAKPGDIVDSTRVEKTFTITDESVSGKFQQMLESIPMAHVLLSERAINYAKI